MERGEEAIRSLALAIRAFFLTLVEGGVPEEAAFQLTRELLIQMFEGIIRNLITKYGQD